MQLIHYYCYPPPATYIPLSSPFLMIFQKYLLFNSESVNIAFTVIELFLTEIFTFLDKFKYFDNYDEGNFRVFVLKTLKGN